MVAHRVGDLSVPLLDSDKQAGLVVNVDLAMTSNRLPAALAFADRFCRDDGDTEEERQFHAYCYATLLDSILQDKSSTIQAHLTLHRYRKMSPRSRYFNLSLQDLLFGMDFYNRVYDRRFSGRSENNPRPPLLRETTFAGCLDVVDEKLEALLGDQVLKELIRRYVQGEGVPTPTQGSAEWLASGTLSWYLQRNNVPVSTLLGALKSLAFSSRSASLNSEPLGTKDEKVLDEGIKEVLHATGTQLTACMAVRGESCDALLNLH